jgi:hypothetical protein
MKRRFCLGASTFGVTTSALILAGCSTPQSRISDHPDIYQGLSSRDQALVNHGQIRSGMSQNAVWLAWGSPDRKIIGNMQGHPTESWIYISYAAYPYYPCYGPWDPYFGAPLVLSVLFGYSAKYSLSCEGRDFRQRQGCGLSVRGFALEPIKNCVALGRRRSEDSDGFRQWLIAHFNSSSLPLNKRAN